jgi:hypothetical protein
MKIKVGLIGKGKWGKKIKKKLNKLANLKFIYGKKNSYANIIRQEKIQWVFIATPNPTHYKIVKECIQNGVNVFCEKPLSESIVEIKKLIDLAKKKKVKLFVSDLYSHYSSKFNKLKNENLVYRSKFVIKSDNEFFYRFMYHDISILHQFFKKNKLANCSIYKNNKKNIFKITIMFKNKKSLIFLYNLRSKKKYHFINNLEIKSNKDVLEEMIKKVLKKNIDFKDNNIKALFIIKLIKKIKQKLNYAN